MHPLIIYLAGFFTEAIVLAWPYKQKKEAKRFLRLAFYAVAFGAAVFLIELARGNLYTLPIIFGTFVVLLAFAYIAAFTTKVLPTIDEFDYLFVVVFLWMYGVDHPIQFQGNEQAIVIGVVLSVIAFFSATGQFKGELMNRFMNKVNYVGFILFSMVITVKMLRDIDFLAQVTHGEVLVGTADIFLAGIVSLYCLVLVTIVMLAIIGRTPDVFEVMYGKDHKLFNRYKPTVFTQWEFVVLLLVTFGYLINDYLGLMTPLSYVGYVLTGLSIKQAYLKPKKQRA